MRNWRYMLPGLMFFIVGSLTESTLLAAPSLPPHAQPVLQGNQSSDARTNATAAQNGSQTGQAPSTAAPETVHVELLSRLQTAIAARQQQLAADTERTEEAKEALSKTYQQTLVDLEEILKAEQNRLKWAAQLEAAPGALELAKQKKENRRPLNTDLVETQLALLSYEEANAKLQTLNSELSAATTSRSSLQEEATRRENRRKVLPQEISDKQALLEQLKPGAARNENATDPVLVESQNWTNEAKQILLTEQIQSLKNEQLVYEAETSLLPLQLELAKDQESDLQDEIRLVEQSLVTRRKHRINEFAADYKQLRPPSTKQLEPTHRQLREWLGIDDFSASADSLNIQLTWQDLADRRSVVADEVELAQAELDRWKQRRSKMDARIDSNQNSDSVADFNSWVGLMLRKQSGELPDVNQLMVRLRYYRQEIQGADSVLFRIEESLFNLRSYADADDGNGLSDTDQEFIDLSIEVLTELRTDINQYLNDLYAAGNVVEQTRGFSRDYQEFIDRHILWIRSCDRFQKGDLVAASEAGRWLLSHRNWSALTGLLWHDMLRWWPLYLVLGVAYGVLISRQSHLRRQLGDVSEKAAKNRCTDFGYTSRALILTLLITVPVPALLFFVIWRIDVASQSHTLAEVEANFVAAISYGLLVALSTLLPMELIRQTCRPNGLGVLHFGWRKAMVVLLRSNLRWMINFGIPLCILIGIFVAQSNPRWESSLGRIAFMVLMPLFSIFVAQIFRPNDGVLAIFIEEHPGGWVDRLSFLWYPAMIVFPILLTISCYLGYQFTAQRIGVHLDLTIWTIVLLSVIYALMERWLTLNRRKIMLAAARQRLEEAAQRDPGEKATEAIKGEEDESQSLAQLNEQTKRLLKSLVIGGGLLTAYWIWSDVLPAIQLLNQFEVWTIKGDDGDIPITLGHLVLMIPEIAIIIIASKNVPGLLEIAFLQHLPLSAAVRYAITTLARYAIVAIGIVVLAGTFGVTWTSVQWLVAALGVGLGFGLQEIFANFISGLILLFEQPIRVGDVITVQGTTGTVSKIRMRATTVVNWDRQELIIPNRDLITGILLNWTLSDSTNRVVLHVGVAYGSDVAKASEIIRKICAEHPEVMHEPGPLVTMEGFGDNTLNLVVRAYLETLDNRLGTIHGLHNQIYQAFNEAGIEIAFPQRDLHIRSFPETLARLFGGKRTAEERPAT